VTMTDAGSGHARKTVPPGGTDDSFVGRAPVAHRIPVSGSAPVSAPRQTLVIPTFNESDNIGALLERLAQVLAASDTEILFVDDSTDDTVQAIEEAAGRCPIPVRVYHRDEAVGGLGGAVVEGMRLAAGEWWTAICSIRRTWSRSWLPPASATARTWWWPAGTSAAAGGTGWPTPAAGWFRARRRR
jgi:hypothetical protein